MVGVLSKVKNGGFEIGMVTLDRSPMLEARYSPINSPEFRIFSQAVSIKYTGGLNLEQLSGWVLRKIGLPQNRIVSTDMLRSKLAKSSLIVVFVAKMDEADGYFDDFVQVSRRSLELPDVEFAFLYPEDFGSEDLGNLARIT